MDKTILQIPVSKTLRAQAEKSALDQGFSSLQEVIRVFMKKLADKVIDISFQEETVRLSPQAEKRYNKIIDDIEKGKNITKTKNLDELFQLLN